MRASAIPSNVLEEMIEFKPTCVFLNVGGNDISSNADTDEIAGDILRIVNILKETGVQHVFFIEIKERGRFRGDLTTEIFTRKRNSINRKIQRKLGRDFFTLKKSGFVRTITTIWCTFQIAG